MTPPQAETTCFCGGPWIDRCKVCGDPLCPAHTRFVQYGDRVFPYCENCLNVAEEIAEEAVRA